VSFSFSLSLSLSLSLSACVCVRVYVCACAYVFITVCVCNIAQHQAILRTLQHTATHCSTLRHTATLPHTATHEGAQRAPTTPPKDLKACVSVYMRACATCDVCVCVCVCVCVHVNSRSTKSAAGRGEGLGGLGASLHRLIHAFNGLEHRLRKFAILHGTFSDVDCMYQRFVAASPWNASCCDGKRRFAGDGVCGHLLKMKDFELLARGVAQGAIHDYRRPCRELPDFGPHTLNQGRHLNLGRVHLHPLIFVFGAAYVVHLYLVLLCVDLLHLAVPATVLSAPTAVSRGDIQRALQTRTPLAPPLQDVSIDSVEPGFAVSFVAAHHAPFFSSSHFFSCRRLALCSGAARKRRVKDLMRETTLLTDLVRGNTPQM